MFSGNIFGGTFNINVVKQSTKRKITSSKNVLEDNMAPTVNKNVKLNQKTTVKMFLKSVSYLGVSATVKTVLVKVNDL